MTDKKITAQELKDKFLQEAHPLVEQYIQAAFGGDAIKSKDPVCRKEVWGLLKGFLEKADEKIILDDKYREGAEGVLLAIQDGVLTLEEGERLIDIHGKIKLMNRPLPNEMITNQAFIPSLTINTLPAPAKQIEDTDGKD